MLLAVALVSVSSACGVPRSTAGWGAAEVVPRFDPVAKRIHDTVMAGNGAWARGPTTTARAA